ncbi:isovaleryl-CoA dehydrogenase [Spectribacter hydrogenoxidans]|uniref:Isovaleryl-CoA dehydrogenase n=1 Tax=Spectribacter hydrogenoxidans TaxID=3075608 RepID=A0ABU3C3W1_9GAMM|nr:isovaleryl-CoA dehydrogenase [Salinisphaera sp. W335]MDT0636235.1 isovaleryl-CoA dehydrogenase [Salinisphaera sp. W335]
MSHPDPIDHGADWPDITHPTHDVTNQPPPLAGANAYTGDQALVDALAREGGGWGDDRLRRFGAVCGEELLDIGFQANENPPKLRAFDRYGHRIDEVEFHPAYHRSMQLAREHGLHSLTWTADRDGAQVVRSALAYLHNQFESGTMCPITMTHAAVPALQHQPDVAEQWLPGILAPDYDPSCRPFEQKTGLTIGMGMTEKQGGSDVRANTTRATPLGRPGPGREYKLVGHKWFFSAPMCDGFLVLAYSEGGLSCFLLPKWRPEGIRNAIHIQRLKDKLGDRSNASSEVEFRGAFGWMIGAEGRGVPTIIEMVGQTRLDCMVGSAGLMRQATAQAIHHCAHREAFGRPLIDQPLMTNVLADLALESEAALALSLRLARAFGAAANGDETEKAFARLATPVGKYWICKRTPAQVNEAQECLGGAGYVEETIMPRLFRQSPLNSIWEGSGNVQCLDVLRAMSRDAESVEAVIAELRAARGQHPAFDAHLARLLAQLERPADLEPRARRFTEDLALGLQASLLIRAGNEPVAQAFCAGRLGEQSYLAYGTLPDGLDQRAIVERARPA